MSNISLLVMIRLSKTVSGDQLKQNFIFRITPNEFNDLNETDFASVLGDAE